MPARRTSAPETPTRAAQKGSRRKAIVEPVFGQMDTTQDAKQLGLRGKPAARKQWQFHAAVHNLLKLHRNGGLALIPSG